MVDGKPTKIAQTLQKIRQSTKGGGTTEAALTLLNELGIGNGGWCLDSIPILERMMEWYEHVPLFVRALAALKRHTLGYMPSSAGVTDLKTFKLDDRRFGHCKRHGALLAVTRAGGRIIPYGMSQLRNELNDAAVRAFIAQEEREPTEEEKQQILFVSAQNLRKALMYLEALGLCLRTDQADNPLVDLRDTEDGATKLKKLSGDNKVRIYLYLRPKASKVKQGSRIGLPSEVMSKELKPLYNVLFGLKLDIAPEALAFDSKLQATIRAEIEQREKMLRERDDSLRREILEQYPSAALPQASAPLNPNAAVLPRRGADDSQGRQTAPEPAAPPSSPAHSPAEVPPPTANSELVSRPRGSAALVRGRDLLSVDSEFQSSLIASFTDYGRRSVPTMRQCAAVQSALPNNPEAREEFVMMLREKMPRIQSPGVLSSIVEEFLTAWPSIVERKQAMQASEPTPHVIRCAKCNDSGMLSGHFETIATARAALLAGKDDYCDCPEGLATRELVDDALKPLSQKGRAS